MDKPKKTDTKLLSPAGGPEAGYAAFFYGADAIYCGLRSFSARAEAVNFTSDELREIVHYAHHLERPREVYVTLNTLMAESDLPEVAETIETIAEAGADAIIVQDLGVARLARAIAPALNLHASTQMAIHNLEGARVATRWGFSQVTLARELTFDEIGRIAAEGIHTEVFIHGALCYSYSGLCLMSAVRNDRSGNRGRCAYPCRERYGVEGTDVSGLAFSMCDLALGEDVRKLADLGVRCLKIEGRMKSPLYVASTTDYYRHILDGTFRSEAERQKAEEDLQTVFSRKSTHLHADGVHHQGVIDAGVTGHRGVPIGTVESVRSFPDGTRWLRFRTRRALSLHDGLQVDLPGQDRPYGFPIDKFDTFKQKKGIVFACDAGDAISVLLPEDAPHIPVEAVVYCSSSQEVKQRFASSIPPALDRKPRTPIDVSLHVRPDEVWMKARVFGNASLVAESRLSDAYSAAKNPERMNQTIAEACGKLGESVFSLRSLSIDNPANLFVPMSQLNEIRRQVCESLSASLVAESARCHAKAAAIITERLRHERPPVKTPERWTVKTDQPSCLEKLDGVDEVVLDLAGVSDEDIARCMSRYGLANVRLGLPVISREWESGPLRQRVTALVAKGCLRWLVTNPSAWDFLPTGCDIETDWTLSVWNSQSLSAWLERGASGVTLSPELGKEDLSGLLTEWGDVATVILYQDTPLMISEACPISALGAPCGACPPQQGHDDPIRLNAARGADAVYVTMQKCRTIVTNERAYTAERILGVLRENGASRWRVDFSIRPYTAEEAAGVWNRIRGL